jgi:hypothetical protein
VSQDVDYDMHVKDILNVSSCEPNIQPLRFTSLCYDAFTSLIYQSHHLQMLDSR